jgi:hypothetical protein
VYPGSLDLIPSRSTTLSRQKPSSFQHGSDPR